MHAALVSCFVAIALLLAAIGVYGLIACVVSQRAREIGIRLALGATRRNVFLELFGQGARLVAAGLVVGIIAAAGLRDVASAFVFGVTTDDPLTYLLAALTFAGVWFTAVVVPARRASRVEPVSALRGD